jgi:hypothetical protein
MIQPILVIYYNRFVFFKKQDVRKWLKDTVKSAKDGNAMVSEGYYANEKRL